VTGVHQSPSVPNTAAPRAHARNAHPQTMLQARRQQQDMERIARVDEAYCNIMAAVDEIYGAIKKMEGAYNNVWKRASRLLRECEKHQLDKAASVGAQIDRSQLLSPDAVGLGSGDSHDLRAIIAAQVASQSSRPAQSLALCARLLIPATHPTVTQEVTAQRSRALQRIAGSLSASAPAPPPYPTVPPPPPPPPPPPTR